MKNRLSVERMIELEKNIEEDNLDQNLEYNEKMYIELAQKIPFKYVVEYINIRKKYKFFLSDDYIKKEILNILNCTIEELDIRFKEVILILKYKNNQMNNLLIEQKKMVKRINS